MKFEAKEGAKIALLTLGGVCAVASSKLPPRILETGSGIDKPHYPKDTVDFRTLLLFLLAAVPISICHLRISKRNAYREIYFFYWAVSGTMLVSNLAKALAGRLRPDFLDRLKSFPANSSVVEEGRRSFPSGHTALAAVSAMYIICYAAKELRRGRVVAPLVLALLFGAGCVFVGASRVLDYRHHVSDVLSGGVLGVAFSSLVLVSVGIHRERERSAQK